MNALSLLLLLLLQQAVGTLCTGWEHEIETEGGWQQHPWLEQIARQEEVERACANLWAERQEPPPPLDVSQLDHVLVDHTHRLLYCYVPKVACTNWKRLFMVLTGVSNVTDPLEIPASVAHDESSTLRLSQLPEAEARACLDTYTAFLVVRHPFERLLSAYRNKFLGNSTSARYFQERYGRQIVRRYRGNETSRGDEGGAGDDVTFDEFARYLAEGGADSNEHWASVQRLCRPCQVRYSFVARYERLAEDAPALLRMAGAPPLALPLTRSGRTGSRLRSHLRRLPMPRLRALYRLYRADFLLFGYHLHPLLGFDLA